MLTTLCSLHALPSSGAQSAPTSASPPSATHVVEVYSVTEVLPRSERSMDRLREIRQKLEADTSENMVEAALPLLMKQVDAWWADERNTLRDGRSVQRLNDLFVEWRVRSAQIDEWGALLSSSSRYWISEREALQRGAENWRATRAAMPADAPPAVLERIAQVQSEIAEVLGLFQKKTARLVSIQGKLLNAREVLGSLRKELDAIQRGVGEELFVRDGPSLWAALTASRSDLPVSLQSRRMWTQVTSDVARLADAARIGMVQHLALLIGLLCAFVFLGSRALSPGGVQATAAEKVMIDRYVSSAFLLALGAVPLLYAQLPPSAQRIAMLPALLPVLRLVPALIPQRFHPAFYCFTAIFLLDFFRAYLPTQWVLARLALLLVSALGAVGLGLLLAHANRWIRDVGVGARPAGVGVLKSLLAAGLALFVLSLLANLTGNLSLAEFLVSPLLRLLLIAVVIWLCVVVASTLGVIALRLPVATASRVIRSRGDRVAIRMRKLLAAAGLLTWCYLAIFNLGLLPAVSRAIVGFLATEWRLGAATLSVRDFIIFFAVLLGSYGLSRLLRLILADEILPRFNFPRGVPDAMVLLTRYGVLLFGFLLALISAGVDLSKVTIALSALGVGIGFGLQNIVNNFVSGLILVFEHPIQVGDFIEVGPHYGRVSRIGFRASTLITVEGAEVVIPNAELIGNKVVNWSLSDASRRISIRVPIPIGTESQKVIDVLKAVASACPEVRDRPAPNVVLAQFGDSALIYELRCWVGTDQMGPIRDQLTLAVDSALRAAGIAIPYPQSEVHLRIPENAPWRAERSPAAD